MPLVKPALTTRPAGACGPALPVQAKSSLFSMAAVKEYVGADVLSLLSVPVFIMEPTSMLQKMSEVLEYAELLDAAAETDDPMER